jgi:hypothetical protein
MQKCYNMHCGVGLHGRNGVPVKCETKRNETKLTKTKRNGIIQNEIKPILTKEFLGEIQDKN